MISLMQTARVGGVLELEHEHGPSKVPYESLTSRREARKGTDPFLRSGRLIHIYMTRPVRGQRREEKPGRGHPRSKRSQPRSSRVSPPVRLTLADDVGRLRLG